MENRESTEPSATGLMWVSHTKEEEGHTHTKKKKKMRKDGKNKLSLRVQIL